MHPAKFYDGPGLGLIFADIWDFLFNMFFHACEYFNFTIRSRDRALRDLLTTDSARHPLGLL